jgi:hypothetical protein
VPVVIEKVTRTFESYTNFVHQSYMSLVQASLPDTRATLWYRGAGRYSYPLRPSLFRHSITDIVELLKLENKLMNRFKQRGFPFVQRLSDVKMEQLFFMQHYGLPTRLLDWSESPFIALYFAITSADVDDNGNYKEDAAVWLLNPIAWNRHLYPQLGDDVDILSPINKKQLEGYEPLENPRDDLQDMGALPVALYGTHNSMRIVGQRGVFTIFGKETAPMESAYVNQGFPNDLLVKIRIPRSQFANFQRALTGIGIIDSVVFPDLEGLAKETKRVFDYKV